MRDRRFGRYSDRCVPAPAMVDTLSLREAYRHLSSTFALRQHGHYQSFRDVDDAFVRHYGERDGSLATWPERILASGAGRLMAGQLATPLVCERFSRVWAAP